MQTPDKVHNEHVVGRVWARYMAHSNELTEYSVGRHIGLYHSVFRKFQLHASTGVMPRRSADAALEFVAVPWTATEILDCLSMVYGATLDIPNVRCLFLAG